MQLHTKIITGFIAIFLSFHVSAENYHSDRSYKATITNLTKGISFTHFLGASHKRHVKLFSLGEGVSHEVERVAEGGDTDPLQVHLDASNYVHSTATTAGLLMPGQSVELEIDSNRRFRKLSLIAMLLPTNDTLVALQGVKLPKRGKVTYYVDAYDAGTETNDELCANIPGPHCGGTPFSPEDEGEGYAYPSPTIHGEADLSRQAYLWDGPVAKVVIERIY